MIYHSNIEIPDFIYDANGDRFELFFEYRMNPNNEFVWTATYLNEHEIHCRCQNTDLAALAKEINEIAKAKQ